MHKLKWMALSGTCATLVISLLPAKGAEECYMNCDTYPDRCAYENEGPQCVCPAGTTKTFVIKTHIDPSLDPAFRGKNRLLNPTYMYECMVIPRDH